MSVKVYKNNEWHDLTGQKIYHNGSWHELKDSAKLYHNGQWHYIDKSKIPLTLTNVGSTNSMISIDHSDSRIILWKRSLNEEWQRWSSNLTLLPGEKVFFEGYGYNAAMKNYTRFSFDGTIAASGNIQSMNEWREGCYPYCYASMFQNCPGLVSAPELPAKELALGCYAFMFSNCPGLVSAPDLPAVWARDSCYSGMFANDINLREIKISFEDWEFATQATSGWVQGIPEGGTFYKPSALPINYGDSSIPPGWAVVNIN